MSQATTTGGAPASEQNKSEAAVQAAIAEISHIATLPEVTMKIIRLVEDPNSTAQDLNQVISHDPALGARILKVVNSAFYGLPGQIGSINRAIVLLGMNAVKNLAIAASLAKLFKGSQICPQFNAKDLWTHSIAVASCTRLLAKHIKLGLPDEAFLAGLIHDLGLMVIMQARRNQMAQVFQHKEANPGLTLRQAELAVLGATHEQFGAGLCRAWKFPNSFIYVTGFHHHPMDVADRNRILAGLVHIADIVAAQCKIGFSASVEVERPDPALMAQLGLTDAHIIDAIQSLPPAIREATAMLQVEG